MSYKMPVGFKISKQNVPTNILKKIKGVFSILLGSQNQNSWGKTIDYFGQQTRPR